MLTETEFARLIAGWKNQFGEDIKGRPSVPVDTAPRISMYKTLMKTLIETHGYTEDDLMGKTYRMVLEASYNPKSPGAETWRKLASDDWISCVDTFFPKSFLIHNPNEETPKQVLPIKIEETKPEAEPEIVGEMALTQEEFDFLTDFHKKDLDIEFLADMMLTQSSKLSKKQSERLTKLKNKADNLQRAKDKASNRDQKIEEELESQEASQIQENPLDRSIFEGLPPVVDPDDEEFLAQLAAIGGKDE